MQIQESVLGITHYGFVFVFEKETLVERGFCSRLCAQVSLTVGWCRNHVVLGWTLCAHSLPISPAQLLDSLVQGLQIFPTRVHLHFIN